MVARSRSRLGGPLRRIPTLDVLRSLAVLLVIISHTDVASVRGGAPSILSRMPFVNGGWMGVDLFFVLSGYLIGGQIWRELKREGNLNVRRFIIRRGYRIWPLYLFIFLSCVIMGRATWSHWWSDLLFLTNYTNHGVVMGSWSLCTEEQFYIAAPAFVLLGLRRRWDPAVYRRLLVGCLLALPAIRAIEWLLFTGSLSLHDNQTAWGPIYTNFHTHCDGLIVGLLLSHLKTFGVPRWAGFIDSRITLIAAFAFFLGLRWLHHEIFIFSGLAIFFGSLLWQGTILSPRFARSPIFYWVSRLSYGMYLNHEYLLRYALKLNIFKSPLLAEITAIAVVVIASAALAYVTFRLIEEPFLQIRDTGSLFKNQKLQSSADHAL
jgi:peptidoglycan/LPS O-acetylase OafA/YrhL